MLSPSKEVNPLVQQFLNNMPAQLLFTTPSLDFAMSSKTIEKMIDQVYCLQKEIFRSEINIEILVLLVHKALLYFNFLTRSPSKKKTLVSEFEDVTEQEIDFISTHEFDPTLTNTQKAYYFYQRGRLLNIFDQHHLASQHNLEKSVKLNPQSQDAWKCLGECYWKNGNLKASESAFRWALGMHNCKSTMLLLAMVIRRKANTKLELEESIRLCKDSLKIELEESMRLCKDTGKVSESMPLRKDILLEETKTLCKDSGKLSEVEESTRKDGVKRNLIVDDGWCTCS
jgi:tetratricopeptide (TPR) repeat protein